MSGESSQLDAFDRAMMHSSRIVTLLHPLVSPVKHGCSRHIEFDFAMELLDLLNEGGAFR